MRIDFASWLAESMVSSCSNPNLSSKNSNETNPRTLKLKRRTVFEITKHSRKTLKKITKIEKSSSEKSNENEKNTSLNEDKINQNSLISISKHLFNIIRAKGKISGTNVSIQSY